MLYYHASELLGLAVAPFNCCTRK